MAKITHIKHQFLNKFKFPPIDIFRCEYYTDTFEQDGCEGDEVLESIRLKFVQCNATVNYAYANQLSADILVHKLKSILLDDSPVIQQNYPTLCRDYSDLLRNSGRNSDYGIAVRAYTTLGILEYIVETST